MDEFTPGVLPCLYYLFCKGLQDPSQPAHGNLCPECFCSIEEGDDPMQPKTESSHLAPDQHEEGRCV